MDLGQLNDAQKAVLKQVFCMSLMWFGAFSESLQKESKQDNRRKLVRLNIVRFSVVFIARGDTLKANIKFFSFFNSSAKRSKTANYRSRTIPIFCDGSSVSYEISHLFFSKMKKELNNRRFLLRLARDFDLVKSEKMLRDVSMIYIRFHVIIFWL